MPDLLLAALYVLAFSPILGAAGEILSRLATILTEGN